MGDLKCPCGAQIEVLTEDTQLGGEPDQIEYLACSNRDCINYDPSMLDRELLLTV